MTDQEAQTRLILCLPDDHKQRILDMLELESNKDNGFVHLKDKNGVVMKFYINQGNLWADRPDGDKVIPQPVITMSEAKAFNEAQKEANRSFKEKVIERIQTDFPDKTKEEVEQDADILNEANESIRKLIASGVAPSVARKIITSVLECSAPPSTPEEMADLISNMVNEEPVKNED
jgi:hypothetical protein